MSRSTPEQRLHDIVDAASRVFATMGYRRAQVADVAAQARVSAGTIYNYVEGKDALFHVSLVMSSPANEPPVSTASLPIATPPPAETLEVIKRGLEAIRRGSVLTSAARATRPPEDIESELVAVIGDIYDRTAGSRRFQALVEGSAADRPELFEEFFIGMRRPGVETLTHYLERRIAWGVLRPLPDVATSARLIIETQAWFARHRRADQDSASISDEAARATVIDMLVAALLP